MSNQTSKLLSNPSLTNACSVPYGLKHVSLVTGITPLTACSPEAPAWAPCSMATYGCGHKHTEMRSAPSRAFIAGPDDVGTRYNLGYHVVVVPRNHTLTCVQAGACTHTVHMLQYR